jgi:hypothetical protein
MAAPHYVSPVREDLNSTADISAFLTPELLAASSTHLWVGDYGVAEQARPEHMVRIPAPLDDVLTDELDGAQEYLGVTADALLLAALGRAIARTFGSGEVVVDAAGRPDLALLTCTTVSPCVASPVSDAAPEDGGADIAFRFGSADVSPAGGHALELRSYRSDGRVQLDWWYDARRFEEYTVQELAEQYPLALIELTSEDSLPIG